MTFQNTTQFATTDNWSLTLINKSPTIRIPHLWFAVSLNKVMVLVTAAAMVTRMVMGLVLVINCWRCSLDLRSLHGKGWCQQPGPASVNFLVQPSLLWRCCCWYHHRRHNNSTGCSSLCRARHRQVSSITGITPLHTITHHYSFLGNPSIKLCQSEYYCLESY